MYCLVQDDTATQFAYRCSGSKAETDRVLKVFMKDYSCKIPLTQYEAPNLPLHSRMVYISQT
jgi:hypothetical protein